MPLSAERPPRASVPGACDVLIVGGGVIGSACAYFLTADPDFDGRVLVVERDAGYREGSTGRSVGGIRQQFSTPENIEMSRFAADFVRAAPARLAVGDAAPELGFVEAGYLFLATAAGRRVLESNLAVQHAHGAQVAALAPAELADRFPWLAVDDLAAGALGLRGEGWLDPFSLLQALRRKARSLGAVFVQDEAVAIERRGRGITSLRLASGARLRCGTLVNAAGPRAARVAAMAGIALPVRPRKRLVFCFSCRSALPACPLVVDPCGLYFRPEGAGFICGIAPPPEEDPDCLDLEVDYTWFEARLWPRLARRVPAFEAIRMSGAWAGHYAYNTFDQNAILGPHPEVENLLLANGFSGHGLQQAPAVGRAVSELIVHGGYRSLDLSRFGVERIAANRPLRELNVV